MATIVTSTVTVSTGAGITTTTTTTSASPAAGEAAAAAAAATPPPPKPAVEFFLVGTDLDGAYKHTQVLGVLFIDTCPAALYAALFYADV